MSCCLAGKNVSEWCRAYPIVFTESNGNEYCIFHAPIHGKRDTNGQLLSVEEFNKRIYERIDRAKEERESCDLSGTIFPGDISFRGYNSRNPLPTVSFQDTEFNREAVFQGVTFSGEADFRFARFSGTANFVGAKFSRNADFSGAAFSGTAVFRKAEFSGVVNFIVATFKDAEFYGETFLEGSTAYFGSLTTEKSITFTNVRMNRPRFGGTDISKCEFVSCQWGEKDGRNILGDETALLEQEARQYGTTVKGRINQFLFKDLRPFDTWAIGRVEELYRNMKLKYKVKGDEFQVSKWHASEREMQRKKAHILKQPLDWILLNIYRSLCGYGENPKRAALVLACMLLFFAILLVGTGFETTSENRETLGTGTAADALLLTLQIAVFERNPSFEPITRAGLFLNVLIKILVPIQTTLLVFALRNRFRR